MITRRIGRPSQSRPSTGLTPARLLAWRRGRSEPSLESLLTDSVLLAVLARNDITADQFRVLALVTGDRLRRRPGP